MRELLSASAKDLLFDFGGIDALELRQCQAHHLLILCFFVFLLQLALPTRGGLSFVPELHLSLYILIARQNVMRILFGIRLPRQLFVPYFLRSRCQIYSEYF